MLKRACSVAITGLLCVLLGLLNGAAHAQEADVARKKCVDFGFQPDTNQHAECVKQFLQSSGGAKPPPKAGKIVGQPMNSTQLEEKFWDAAVSIGNSSAFEGYLQTYPKGRYVALARAGLERLSESSAAQQQAATDALQKLATERAAFEAEQRVARDRAAGDAAEKTAAAEATKRASAILQAANEAMRKLVTERAAFEAEQKLARERAVVELADKTAAADTAKRALASLSTGQLIKECNDCPEMVVIPAASFTMGSNANPGEQPMRRVTLAGYLIGRTEVTQGQWRAVMGSNPTGFSQCGDDCPVEQVSWNDAQDFLRRLNQKTGKQYRLPSEAEWEYAARAGSNTKWGFGDNENQLGNYAWYSANSQRKTQRVAQKIPNAFGLYDMHGNVWEWVDDCWHANYDGAPQDGGAWITNCTGNSRMLRGGSWSNDPALLRSTMRFSNLQFSRLYFIGLRLARSL
jgi:formylglycine-generating enzyme required for sulfatase activity